MQKKHHFASNNTFSFVADEIFFRALAVLILGPVLATAKYMEFSASTYTVQSTAKHADNDLKARDCWHSAPALATRYPTPVTLMGKHVVQVPLDKLCLPREIYSTIFGKNQAKIERGRNTSCCVGNSPIFYRFFEALNTSLRSHDGFECIPLENAWFYTATRMKFLAPI